MLRCVITVLLSVWGLLVWAAKAVEPLQPFANVAFTTPEDWVVSTDDQDNNHSVVVAESPSGALLVTEILKAESPMSLIDFARSYSKRVNSSMGFAKIQTPTFAYHTKIGQAIGINGVHEQFTLEAFGNSITFIREYFVKSVSGETVYIVSQSIENEWAAHQKDFGEYIKTLSFLEAAVPSHEDEDSLVVSDNGDRTEVSVLSGNFGINSAAMAWINRSANQRVGHPVLHAMPVSPK